MAKFAIARHLGPAVVLLGGLAACTTEGAGPGDDDGNVPPDPAPQPEPPPREAPKAVYILSNEADANRVVVFARAGDGSLRAGNAYATGGRGSAGGLGSQGALVFDAESNRFFAVNAGDHSISMLALEPDGSLSLRAHVPAGGVRPISVTALGDLVYVVNAGDATTAANIAGFRISGDKLAPIAGSIRPLSAAQPAPAQIQFSPDGELLVVTEKATNMINTYRVSNGVAGEPNVQPSAGQTPFGFTWTPDGQLLVSEAFGGGAGLGASSSYAVAATGALTPVSSSIPSSQAAPCWIVYARGHAYVTNTASNTITAYSVAADGRLTLDQPDGVAAATGMGPIDADASDGDAYLYVLDARDDSIGIYAIGADGALTRSPELVGVSANAVGLIAR